MDHTTIETLKQALLMSPRSMFRLLEFSLDPGVCWDLSIHPFGSSVRQFAHSDIEYSDRVVLERVVFLE